MPGLRHAEGPAETAIRTTPRVTRRRIGVVQASIRAGADRNGRRRRGPRFPAYRARKEAQ
jgi:hypothetical protein